MPPRNLKLRIRDILEAVNAVLDYTDLDIPWQDMRDMRNFVVHEYFGVSDRIIWDTVQNDLPSLIRPLKKILGEQTPYETV